MNHQLNEIKLEKNKINDELNNLKNNNKIKEQNIEKEKLIQTIKEYKGLVTGEALIGANIYKDLFSGVRDVVGGRTSSYEEEIKKARDIAFRSMEEKAEQLNANAIIGIKISYDNLGGTMGNTILITAYGTAILYEENEN